MRKIKPTLRTCASCEWIFRMRDNDPGCPRCGFGSYGAYRVYGNAAYRFQYSQKPWKDKNMQQFEMKLNIEIQKAVIENSVVLTKALRDA